MVLVVYGGTPLGQLNHLTGPVLRVAQISTNTATALILNSDFTGDFCPLHDLDKCTRSDKIFNEKQFSFSTRYFLRSNEVR